MRWRQTVSRALRLKDRARFGGAIVLGVGAAFLAIAAILLSYNLTQLRESFQWVDHANTVLQQASGLKEQLLLAQSSARGLALTGEASYRSARDRAAGRARDDARGLADLVSGNPGQTARAVHIRSLTDRYLAGLAAADESAPQTGQHRLGDEASALLDRFRATQLTLLRARQDRARRDTAIAMLLAIAAGGLAIAAGVLGMGIFQRQRHRSALRETQIELMHVQRLNTMGMTASALAHEINQPLSAASNYLAALHRYVATSAGSGKILDAAERAAAQVQRAGAVVARLRNFIDKHDAGRALEDPAMLARDAIALLGTLDSTLTLTVDIPDHLPSVAIDRVEIQQVLVNLMRNAIEAMAAGPRHALNLSLARRQIGDVQFSLADSGPGLPPGMAARLFKPFVTTKDGGMGVGLSICRNIVQAHGGRIWTEPNPAGGTIFRFTIPAAEKAEGKAA